MHFGFIRFGKSERKGIFKMTCLYKLMMNETTFWNSEFIRFSIYFSIDYQLFRTKNQTGNRLTSMLIA
jgi:hypothetical protein